MSDLEIILRNVGHVALMLLVVLVSFGTEASQIGAVYRIAWRCMVGVTVYTIWMKQ